MADQITQPPKSQIDSPADVDVDVKVAGNEVRTHFNIVVVGAVILGLLISIIIGLVVLEVTGVIDDFVSMKKTSQRR